MPQKANTRWPPSSVGWDKRSSVGWDKRMQSHQKQAKSAMVGPALCLSHPTSACHPTRPGGLWASSSQTAAGAMSIWRRTSARWAGVSNREKGPPPRHAPARPTARAASPAETRARSPAAPGRPGARDPDPGQAVGAESRRPRGSAGSGTRRSPAAAATRSGFCTCGTPGNVQASSRASSFAACRAP